MKLSTMGTVLAALTAAASGSDLNMGKQEIQDNILRGAPLGPRSHIVPSNSVHYAAEAFARHNLATTNGTGNVTCTNTTIYVNNTVTDTVYVDKKLSTTEQVKAGFTTLGGGIVTGGTALVTAVVSTALSCMFARRKGPSVTGADNAALLGNTKA